MSDPAFGDLRILIEIGGARLWRDGHAGPVVAYDNHDQWSALRGEAARVQRVVAVIADDAGLMLTLPALPHDDGELRCLLDEWAPLRSRELVSTRAFASDDGNLPSVMLVRRNWFDQRIRAVTARLESKQFAITDERGNEFLHRRRFDRHSRKLAISAMLVLAVLLIFGTLWWFDGHVAGQTHQRDVRVQAKSVAEPKQSMPTVASSTQSPGSLAVQPKAAASVIAQARHDASDIVLIGVVGRLPDDAQVLVRPAWGRTVTLRIGDSLLGWRLVGIAQDQATFDRAGERAQIRIKPR